MTLPAGSAPTIGKIILAILAAAAAAAWPGRATAQEDIEGWNGPRVRRLVERAIDRRAEWAGGDLRDYRASATGHIYFLYDLGRGTPRHLVKADQLALQLFWLAPGRTRQLIVGRRETKLLPTDIRYHLDHLTVVMDNLGDRVTMGEGSEVRDALHPAAPSALGFYDYRLSDSLTLVLPEREIRVYEVGYRPRDAGAPGLVGTMFLDRESADIVRMEFTFTAASYLDPTLDYFNVRLENSLWDGRYWLPYGQGIELRRELEWLSFPAGGIIRAEFRIRDYRFDTGLSAALFGGARVASLPRQRLRAYEFESDLLDALDPAVATSPPSMEEIRREASRLVAESYLQRGYGLRLAVPGASSVLRFRRGEGLYVGPGISQGAAGAANLVLTGGYAFGGDRGQLGASLQAPLGSDFRLLVDGYWNRAADVSPWPASSGVMSTFAALLVGEDYRDPYWSSGGRLALERTYGGLRGRLGLGWEEWEPASLEADEIVDRGYRAVRELDDGEVGLVMAEFGEQGSTAAEAVGGTTWEVRAEGATRDVVGDFDYLRAVARLETTVPAVAGGFDLRVSGAVGAAGGGKVPAQRLFPVGGRGTVRGYAFHRHIGNLFGALGVEVRRPVARPIVSVALFGDVAWTGIEGEAAARAVENWNRIGPAAGAARGPLVGAGAGVGLLFDILHIELARGLTRAGLWELVVRVRSEFWDWL